MSQNGSLQVRCWRARIPADEVEALLARLRGERPSVLIQAFRSESDPNLAAVEMIVAQTLLASKSGTTLAERPEVDLLLRLGGTRQIGEAFEKLGYKSGRGKLFLVAASEQMKGEGDVSRLARSLPSGKFKELKKKELGSEDLEQVERAALLAAGL